MNKLLEQAFARASKLSDTDQKALAIWILEELESDLRWDKTFEESADLLAQMAEEALKEHREGKTLPLDPDTL